MIAVVLIGTGNVAQNLFQVLATNPDVDIRQVIGRKKAHLNFALGTTKVATDLKEILPADVYILAISDEAIPLVSKEIEGIKGLVVHTSGGTSLASINNHTRCGVFYPLQTFTKGKMISFEAIPLCIEAKQSQDLQLLKKLGVALSKTVVEIDSEKRKALHLAAVFVNNFTNYLYSVAEDICEENEVDFNLLKPLMKETVAKLDDLTPLKAQTGPAKRGDQKTLHTHLSLIKNKQQRDIYTLLSNTIKSTYGEKL
ncbi:Rossmann-like and DUF2520 domain-containing protein [Maribacter sp. X9]|uniref:Rossmann-like and DUF2520 domain-containing protein n=1 Tax=Maribacter sp. X9 TaxID=3402159 RepID=UPI003AF3434D